MKVALFLRVSTSGQTTDNQEKELRELCERREFEIVEVYKETVSGTKKNEDRVEFSRMIKDMRLRKFKKVVVYSIDRLGRDMKELVKTLSLLDDYNISLFSHQQNLDTDDSMSKMFFYFVSIFSEFENNIRKDRQALGIERLRRENKKYGGNDFISDDIKNKVIDLRTKGLSLRKIQKQVNVSLGSVSNILRAVNG